MSTRAPYIRFYVNDFLGSNKVAAMSSAEVGAHVMLMCRAWTNDPPATIPDDDKVLARWARMSPAEWAQVKANVLAAWRVQEDGRLVQPRLQVEYNKMLRDSERRQAAGKAAANARWNQDSCDSHASRMRHACVTHAMPDSRSQIQADSKEADTPLPPPRRGGTAIRRGGVSWAAGQGWSGITDEDRRVWTAAYPACDLDRQFSAMTAWLDANPERARKSNWRRFIVNWLRRSQDRGGDRRPAPTLAHVSTTPEPTAEDVARFLEPRP